MWVCQVNNAVGGACVCLEVWKDGLAESEPLCAGGRGRTAGEGVGTGRTGLRAANRSCNEEAGVSLGLVCRVQRAQPPLQRPLCFLHHLHRFGPPRSLFVACLSVMQEGCVSELAMGRGEDTAGGPLIAAPAQSLGAAMRHPAPTCLRLAGQSRAGFSGQLHNGFMVASSPHGSRAQHGVHMVEESRSPPDLPGCP